MEKIEKLLSAKWAVPALLFVLCGLTYLPFITELGFYWDDWSTVVLFKFFPSAEFWQFFDYTNRPLSGWTYLFFGFFNGVDPVKWHFLAFLLRWGTTLMFWLFLRVTWPKAKRPALLAALLFAIYPVFTQHALAMTFHQHWTAYFLHLASLTTMALALRRPEKRVFWFSLSFLTLGLHLAVFEYFVGAELLRPVVIWAISADRSKKFGQQIKTTLLTWVPFLLILLGFVAWRVWFQPLKADDPNKINLISGLMADPVGGLKDLLGLILTDLKFIFVNSWFKNPVFELAVGRFYNLMILALAFFSMAAVFGFLFKFQPPVEEGEQETVFQNPQLWVLIGLLQILLAGLIIWSTGRIGSLNFLSGRFIMSTMIGASMAWAGLLEWLTPRWLQKSIIISMLVGLGAYAQLRAVYPYRESWEDQLAYDWNLVWRAPAIEPGTALFSDETMFPYARRNFGINLLYNQPQNESHELPYWHYLLRSYNPTVSPMLFGPGEDVSNEFREFSFHGVSDESLVIVFDNHKTTHCLWVLDPEDVDLPYLTDEVRFMVPVSNPERILSEAPESNEPIKVIFGEEPPKSWCWYFEKADLAVQYEDWPQAADLADQAIAQGYKPEKSSSDVPYEWLPFINAYANTGRVSEALDLTLRTYQKDPNYRAPLCRTWAGLSEKGLGSQSEIDQVMAQMECAE